MRHLVSATALAIVIGVGGSAALADEHELFMMLDADDDSQITREEFVTYSEGAYDDAVMNSPEDKLFTRDYTEQRIHRDDEPVDTMAIDADQDEYVDRDEAMADADASFASLDENGDGVIDADEWAATGK